MFTIDLTLKNTPFPVSVQRKSAEEAEAVYKQILETMRSGTPDIVELTCDRQGEKKLPSVLVKFLEYRCLRKTVQLLAKPQASSHWPNQVDNRCRNG